MRRGGKELDIEYIRDTFEYSEEAKGLLWRRDQRPRGKKGQRAGSLHEASGYWMVSIGGSPTPESRVVWALFSGDQPPTQVSHKNGVKTDNRIENLHAMLPIGKKRVTHAELLEIIHYAPEAGIITWKKPGSNRVSPGDLAGCGTRGRAVIRINDILYASHVIAWFYMTGEWPERMVDHKDRDPSNNKWTNLRLATSAQNIWNSSNKSRGNETGYRGVEKYGNKFVSRIMKKGRRYSLGTFDTPEEAHIAYKNKCLELHGEFSIYHREDTA